MRYYLLIAFVVLLIHMKAQSSFNFLLVNYTQSDSITCRNPQLHFGVVNLSTLTPITYSWASNSNTFVGTNFTVNAPGIYTVTATASNSTSLSKSFTVSSYTVSPSISITPSLQNISCTLTPLSHTLSCSNLTFNVSQRVLSPHGGAYIAAQPNVIYEPGAPGVYTVVTTNTQNGCETSGSFTITSNDTFHYYSLFSNQSFTLGCQTKSIANVSVNPPAPPFQFTLQPGNIVGPAGYTINTPGTYTLVAKDLFNSCLTRHAFSVYSNTISPTLDSLIIPDYILTCKTPSTIVRVVSKHPEYSYTWFKDINVTFGNTLTVQSLTSAFFSSVAAQCSLTITNTISSCISKTTVGVYQNLFPPKATIVLSRNCMPEDILLTNMSTSGLPPFYTFIPGEVIADLWEGPAPQPTLQLSNTYTASTPGQYFLTALDKSNGCKSKTNVELSLCVSLSEHLNTSDNIFSIYPNTTNDSFIISLNDNTSQDYSIEVLNLIGKTIQMHNFSKTVNNLNFSVENLPTGIYFVRATSGEKVMIKKVVVN